jgi:hypothetical protein
VPSARASNEPLLIATTATARAPERTYNILGTTHSSTGANTSCFTETPLNHDLSGLSCVMSPLSKSQQTKTFRQDAAAVKALEPQYIGLWHDFCDGSKSI